MKTTIWHEDTPFEVEYTFNPDDGDIEPEIEQIFVGDYDIIQFLDDITFEEIRQKLIDFLEPD